MKAHVRLGKIFGIEIGLHYSWLLIATLIALSLAAYFGAAHPEWSRSVIWSMAIATALMFFVAIVLHELTHAFVARSKGLPVASITLFALGGVAEIEKESPDAKTEFWIGISGPLMSFALGFLCLAAARLTGWTAGSEPLTPALAALVWLGYTNIALAVFNLFPGYPMDGGRVLRSIIWRVTGNAARATKAAAIVSEFMAVGFIFFGLFLFFNGTGLGGLWIAFIGWFLLNAAKASYLQVEFKEALRGVSVADLMARDFPVVDGVTSIRELVDNYLLKTGRRSFMVTENGEIAGMVTLDQIKSTARRLWAFKTVSDVMTPVGALYTVTPETPLETAAEIVGRENVNQLPVLENGQLKGVISREIIMNYLFTRRELNL